MKFIRKYFLIMGPLALLNGGAGYIVYDHFGQGAPQSAVSESARQQVAPSVSAPTPSRPPQMAPLSGYSEITKRPLFSETRRPPQPEPPPKPVAKPRSPANFTLVGIIQTPEKKSALMKSPTRPMARLISEGQKIEHWKVEKIGDGGVLLQAGEHRTEIKIKPITETGQRHRPPTKHTRAANPRRANGISQAVHRGQNGVRIITANKRAASQ